VTFSKEGKNQSRFDDCTLHLMGLKIKAYTGLEAITKKEAGKVEPGQEHLKHPGPIWTGF
jgi:hypothetical protein